MSRKEFSSSTSDPGLCFDSERGCVFGVYMPRVIYTPVAGPKIFSKIDRIRVLLSERGIPFEIVETSGPGEAVLLAREDDYADAETVIAVGGDGTINEAANGLAGGRTRLVGFPPRKGGAVLPGGGVSERGRGGRGAVRGLSLSPMERGTHLRRRWGFRRAWKGALTCSTRERRSRSCWPGRRNGTSSFWLPPGSTPRSWSGGGPGGKKEG